jgi:hypothetical protein
MNNPSTSERTRTVAGQAMQLLRAATHDERGLTRNAQLRCLQAITDLSAVLDDPAAWPDLLDHRSIPQPGVQQETTGTADELIREALRSLGSLDLAQFAHPHLRSAAKHARRALLAAS